MIFNDFIFLAQVMLYLAHNKNKKRYLKNNNTKRL
ncbi:hypothetical protein AvCA_04810 [Azotobacter vinelandii CA]|uniref:Uncharacterized protein n=2 Tax=Azotobacter vinelandii TaxID=354 RepID=C1DJF0_AZOVD|nr:hypothetical protein Avin_04810 [Azotobacter vinelandii DJ]AGK17286.1 hypothetical protein AvCA_04810 [Azotobacter vinelandii CA]AGK19327.1 hypothetical protein AvCA6_04810 [Azotobacter vinelandii CA6]